MGPPTPPSAFAVPVFLVRRLGRRRSFSLACPRFLLLFARFPVSVRLSRLPGSRPPVLRSFRGSLGACPARRSWLVRFSLVPRRLGRLSFPVRVVASCLFCVSLPFCASGRGVLRVLRRRGRTGERGETGEALKSYKMRNIFCIMLRSSALPAAPYKIRILYGFRARKNGETRGKSHGANLTAILAPLKRS